jgi:hypothetical protein
MLKELKKLLNSTKKLKNTKKPPLSSLKPEDSSLITSKVLKVKLFSFKEVKFSRTQNSLPQELL